MHQMKINGVNMLDYSRKGTDWVAAGLRRVEESG